MWHTRRLYGNFPKNKGAFAAVPAGQTAGGSRSEYAGRKAPYPDNGGRIRFASGNGAFSAFPPPASDILTAQEIGDCLRFLTEYSLHSFEESLCRGISDGSGRTPGGYIRNRRA